eukprot:4673504-Amphidinium_carterae.1
MPAATAGPRPPGRLALLALVLRFGDAQHRGYGGLGSGRSPGGISAGWLRQAGPFGGLVYRPGGGRC